MNIIVNKDSTMVIDRCYEPIIIDSDKFDMIVCNRDETLELCVRTKETGLRKNYRIVEGEIKEM